MSGGRAMEFKHFKEALFEHYEKRKDLVQKNRNVAVLKAEGELCREQFLERACLEPPSQVRLINCHATCEENQVVLIDWCVDQQVQYSAISHTFGMEVYGVFDCECTTKCFTKVPRCSEKACQGHAADGDPRNRVMKDILNMCAILRNAGVQYAWHDGVCIAQHNNAEVEDTIKHIGWIYSHARETIIFLHYVGEPMAPIRPDRDFQSCWHTRVWTLQEAALSKCRRYCLRVGTDGDEITLGDCKSLQEFEDKVARWYRDDSSKVTVIEEDEYWKLLIELYTVIIPLCTATDDPATFTSIKPLRWAACISEWVVTLNRTCFQFPTVAVALDMCSARDSKHEGDRINSILALAGVRDFIAPKDGNMEASTIEFFKRQGQQGLARAVFTANVGALEAHHVHDEYGRTRQHTWVPILSSSLKTVYESVKESIYEIIEGQVTTSAVERFMDFTVLEDGKLELRGDMACVDIKFTYHRTARKHDMPATLSVGDSSYTPSGPLVVRRQLASNSACASIAMDLIFDMDGFHSALAQASSLALGTAVVPMVSTHAADRTSTPVQYDDAVLKQHAAQAAISLVSNGTLERACSAMESGWMQAVVPPKYVDTPHELTRIPALSLGMAIFPILSSGGLGPLVQGREMQDGESFWAHMVLPLPALLQHQALTCSRPASQVPYWDWRVPGLLVQGDMNAPVSKIGCFHLKNELKDICTVLLPALTKIQKLVII